MRILVVEDEKKIADIVANGLRAANFEADVARDGDEAFRKLKEETYDGAVLDIMLPGRDGLSILRQLREGGNNVPIVLLTAKGSDADKVKGLEMGADDYLAKPFNPEELTARVRAVLRRAVGAPGPSHEVVAGDVKIDLHTRLVWRGGERVALTRTEWMLLQHLAANPGRILLNAELLSKVWGPEYRGDLQYLRVWVSRLRKKLEPDPSNPSLIKTFQGIGYMLEIPEEGHDAADATHTAVAASG